MSKVNELMPRRKRRNGAKQIKHEEINEGQIKWRKKEEKVHHYNMGNQSPDGAMSVISVDSQRLIIDEQQHYSRPASRDPWAPPSTFEAKSYDYDSSSWSPPPPTTTSSEKKKVTHEVAIQCELPIPVVKPASTDAFTQSLSQPANNRHMLSVDTFEKKIKQRRHNEAKRDGLDARLSQIKKWMDQGEIF